MWSSSGWIGKLAERARVKTTSRTMRVLASGMREGRPQRGCRGALKRTFGYWRSVTFWSR